MDHLLDEAARILASSIPRRRALRLLTGAFIGGILGALGIERAEARSCSGKRPCPPPQQCCLGKGEDDDENNNNNNNNNDNDNNDDNNGHCCHQTCCGHKCCEKGEVCCGNRKCCDRNETCTADGRCVASRGSNDQLIA